MAYTRQQNQPTEELQKLEGVVEHVIYESPDSQYTVFEVDSGGADVVVSGSVGHVDIGMSVTAYGRMVDHPQYGEQFAADCCEAVLPQDTASILSYLSSGALPHIGPSTAKKLVEKFGNDTLQIIAEQPEKLCELRGLNTEKARQISETFRRQYGAREVIAWMARFGLSAQAALEVYRIFGPHTVEALNNDPYLLCGEPLHLKFEVADRIAHELSFEQNSSLRITAGLLYTLQHVANSGHTCLPRQKLVETTARFILVEPDAVERGLEELLGASDVREVKFGGKGYVYLPDLLSAERTIAAELAERAKSPTKAPQNFESDLSAMELVQGFAYAALQRKAIRLALSSRVMVLTGGPGTGKTTTVDAILNLYKAHGEDVSLCAPTGRAAKRLSELTGHKAFTVHRLLEVDYSSGTVRFIHNEKNQLHCDVVILDEVSMMDVKLFQALLCALRPHCRLVLVGDADQLPSVGAGNVLAEILRAEALPTVRLTEIFRQAQQSLIVQNAHRIVNGQLPQQGKKSDDCFFLPAIGMACQRLVGELVTQRLPKTYGFDPVRDIQVLCPTKRGPAGSQALNLVLQQLLNPPTPGKGEVLDRAGNRVFRVGDKVMQIKNDYDIVYERVGGEAGAGVYNGDMGIILAADASNHALTVQMDDRVVTYSGEQLNELEPAYAITVHKSQGSEFPAVVLALSGVPAKLCYRNLLYTGVSRARRLCVMAGEQGVLAAMVKNVQANRRYSCLGWMLQQEAKMDVKADG